MLLCPVGRLPVLALTGWLPPIPSHGLHTCCRAEGAEPPPPAARRVGLPPLPAAPLAAQQPVSAALLSRVRSKKVSRHLQAAAAASSRGWSRDGSQDQRDVEAGTPLEGESPRASGSADGEGEEGLQELRLRVLNGMKRHFRAQRLAGLLSPDGLRVAK